GPEESRLVPCLRQLTLDRVGVGEQPAPPEVGAEIGTELVELASGAPRALEGCGQLAGPATTADAGRERRLVVGVFGGHLALGPRQRLEGPGHLVPPRQRV